MSRTKRYSTGWGKVVMISGLLCLAVLALSGCVDPPPIVAVPPTATVFFPEPTDIPIPTPKPTFGIPDFPLPAPSLEVVGPMSTKSCVICHTSKDFLIAAADVDRLDSSFSRGKAWEGALPALEAWEKVLLDEEALSGTMHGRYGCTTCHGGQGDSVFKGEAHQGLVRDPDSAQVCGHCHADEVAAHQNSLHAKLTGFWTALAARTTPEQLPQLQEMADNHCQPCHTTCGQCHISRPTHTGGGLLAGHQFSSPPMDSTCNGCHSNRVEAEYKGRNSGVQGDVHWTRGKMACSACHSVNEIHGEAMVESTATHRYDDPPTPSCLKARCHPDVGPGDGIEQHDDTHLGAMSCQACHSTSYQNCYGCHVTMTNNKPGFDMEPSQMMLKIGLNPLRGFDRPWKYVPLRHVPIARDSFAYYGQNLLPNFDALPTWKYATPHNIQRVTPQNEDCNACHGNAEVFLTADDVSPGERKANEDVIVKIVPGPLP